MSIYGYRILKCYTEWPKTSSGEPKTTQNGPKRAQDDPKQSQRRPKTTPRGAQEGQKSEPKSQDEKRTEPRRSQDRLGSPSGGVTPVYPHPRGPPKRPLNRSLPSGKPKKSDIFVDANPKGRQGEVTLIGPSSLGPGSPPRDPREPPPTPPGTHARVLNKKNIEHIEL